MRTRLVVAFHFVLGAFGCSAPHAPEPVHGPVELVLLHSADTHSQLFPWATVIGAADARRGLGGAGELADVGGFARLSTLIRRERGIARRVLHLDSGDLFQGSLAFERFGGEPEVLAFDALGVDAQALGNHELDHGAGPVVERYGRLATFPLLAANYTAEGEGGIGEAVEPFAVLDAAGLRVGVIGVGNVGSVGLLRKRPSELGVAALDAARAVQGAIDLLRPVCDLIVAVTHLGLSADEALVRETSGIDVVLGGHQHIALDEPDWVRDCAGGEPGEGRVRNAWGGERNCTSRNVPIVHSSAYAKFLGKLELWLDDDPAALGERYDPLDRHEITGVRFELLPIDGGTPEDPALAALLEPYRPTGLDALTQDGLLGFAPAPAERIGVTGGDSPLGNFAAEAARRSAQTELAVIGASSLRHDLPPGLLDASVLTRVLPFDDPLVEVRLTGAALQRAFEHAARSAASRDCRTQVQVSGLLVRFRCPCEDEPCARVYPSETDVSCRSDADCSPLHAACGAQGRCFAPLVPEASYALATTRYLADGGSGLFDPVLATSRPAGDGVLSAVTEALREGPLCSLESDTSGCDSGCPAALVARVRADCEARGLGAVCTDPVELCAHARASCSRLPCLDAALARRDGRIRFEAP